MNVFRRLSSRGLAVLLGAIATFGVVAAVATVAALGGGGTTPPAEPLAQAIHDGLSAAPVQGVTARVTFTNNLLGSSALGSLAAGSGSPLLSGASGRIWLTNDGHLRLELQSGSGDAQIVSDGKTLTVYDASSNTAYELALPAQGPDSTTPADHAVPGLSEIDTALTQLESFATVSDAVPGSTAGQPSYTVSVSPKANGGLVSSAELGWDAATGVPLHAAIYAKGDTTPVLDLTVTDISYGPVASSDVNVTPPPGAKIETLSLPTAGTEKSGTPVTGLAAVAAAVPFTLAAPDTLDGLARNEVRLTGSGADAGALVTYGEGLSTIAVLEHAPAAKDASSPLSMLPSVTINGATGHELVTALGTIVHVTSGGVAYTIAGSVTQSDAESAARALTS
ncbi:MAG TPA: hypothetical protein VG652_03205 [Gaiellaceae bacterium]|nr:hypothetical protein [Gaiellaceae bacterium]